MTERLNISNLENALECLDLIVEDEYYLMVNPLFLKVKSILRNSLKGREEKRERQSDGET